MKDELQNHVKNTTAPYKYPRSVPLQTLDRQTIDTTNPRQNIVLSHVCYVLSLSCLWSVTVTSFPCNLLGVELIYNLFSHWLPGGGGLSVSEGGQGEMKSVGNPPYQFFFGGGMGILLKIGNLPWFTRNRFTH